MRLISDDDCQNMKKEVESEPHKQRISRYGLLMRKGWSFSASLLFSQPTTTTQLSLPPPNQTTTNKTNNNNNSSSAGKEKESPSDLIDSLSPHIFDSLSLPVESNIQSIASPTPYLHFSSPPPPPLFSKIWLDRNRSSTPHLSCLPPLPHLLPPSLLLGLMAPVLLTKSSVPSQV